MSKKAKRRRFIVALIEFAISVIGLAAIYVITCLALRLLRVA